jgi:hypothetical protein
VIFVGSLAFRGLALEGTPIPNECRLCHGATTQLEYMRIHDPIAWQVAESDFKSQRVHTDEPKTILHTLSSHVSYESSSFDR